MIPISACIITKDEAEKLDKCLAALSAYPFELVVVDTGSTDNSPEVAHKYTDMVYNFTWINDFSAARNFAADCASNDFIIYIDTDELVSSLDWSELQRAIEQYPKSVGSVQIRNYYETDAGMQYQTDTVTRIYHKKHYHFEDPIHEQLCPLSDIPCTYYKTSVVLDHSGYLGNKEQLRKKSERNLTLLFDELKRNDEDPYLYFQIAQSYLLTRDHERACKYMKEALLRNPPPQSDYTRVLICNYGSLLLQSERPFEALPLLSYYEYYSDNMDYLCIIGLILMHVGQPMKALPIFIQAKTAPSKDSIDPRKPSYYIGYLYEFFGKKEIAKTHYQNCGDYPPAVEALKRIT